MRLFLYFSMMVQRFALVIFFLSSLLGCGDGRSSASKESAAVSTRESAEKEVREEIFIPATIQGQVDILYFRKPFTDSVRYTRYYRVAQTTDTSFFAGLRAALQQRFEKLDAPRKCLSEGKMQVPLGGDAFKVVYFSRKETGCPYLYVIKDGMFYYFELPAELNRFLIELEEQSKEV